MGSMVFPWISMSFPAGKLRAISIRGPAYVLAFRPGSTIFFLSIILFSDIMLPRLRALCGQGRIKAKSVLMLQQWRRVD